VSTHFSDCVALVDMLANQVICRWFDGTPKVDFSRRPA
jgi:hypothetical protein